MTSPVQPIVNRQLDDAASVLYQSPAGVYTQITSLSAINVDVVAHTVTFAIVPSGQSEGAEYYSTKAQAILPGNTLNSANEYGKILGPGDALYGFADTDAVVNVIASGVLAT